jgi:hypothetical protein
VRGAERTHLVGDGMVKEPFLWPKNRAAASSSVISAQFTTMNGFADADRCRREDSAPPDPSRALLAEDQHRDRDRSPRPPECRFRAARGRRLRLRRVADEIRRVCRRPLAADQPAIS